MNPHIGDMRRMHEFKQAFVTKHSDITKHPECNKRNIHPELRSIPLTPTDCENQKPMRDRVDWIACKKVIGECHWLVENGYCPKGFVI
jgi:hypothetical protein